MQTLIVYSLLNDRRYCGDGGDRPLLASLLAMPALGQTSPVRLLLHHQHHFPDMRAGIQHPVRFACLGQWKGFKDLRLHRPGFN